jgi:hypothetical protein
MVEVDECIVRSFVPGFLGTLYSSEYILLVSFILCTVASAKVACMNDS